MSIHNSPQASGHGSGHGLLDDAAVVDRVLEHVRGGTTDVGDGVWREPVASYRCPERLDAEVQRVLRRTATPFCPSAALPRAGSFVARPAAGVPLVAVRGDDGRVRAFRNACRHRGTELASGAGCRRALVCPYHGWTYGLDGALRHVPHADGFPGLDPARHGLVPVAAEEHRGLVFVTQQAPKPGGAGPAPWEGLPELVAADAELLDAREVAVDVNWKIHLEGFLEGYHIRSTHPQSFYPYGYDNLTLVERCGANSRVTFPFRRIEKLASVPRAERRVDGLLTYVYHLFPNALVTVLSRHTNLVVLEPVAVDRTRLVVYTLTNRGDGDAESARRDAAFVGSTGAAEDLAVALAVQRGLGTGANDVFTFGRFESAIAHFHRNLGAALAP